MEVLNARQSFTIVNGVVIFLYTKVLFYRDGVTFCAKSPHRHVEPHVSADDLEDIQPIPPEAYRPLLPSRYALAPNPNDCHIKQPNLTLFGGEIDLTSLVLQELAACEVLRQHPHPNIATYYGCLASEGRVTGLCFRRYPENLMSKINPGHLNKSMFMLSEDLTMSRKSAIDYLPGIEEGIRHLHALGIIHNDLNPSNIMITADDVPVVIDFDSSCAPETVLDKVKRTHGWFDPNVRVARESNDLDALEELRVWLSGSSPEQFRFKE